jgi:hypothetical protein
MRTLPATVATAVAATALLVLAGCGSQTGDTAEDPGPSGSPTSSTPPSSTPAGIPAAPGAVGSRDLVTVMDTGSPELCLGPVAESDPPQCSGPPIQGWSWKEQHGAFERSGDIRWGLFSVQGTWDGRTFTVTSAIPAALYDPPADDPEQPPLGGDNGTAGPYEDKILDSLTADPVPGTLTVTPTPGTIVVDVVYDDGTLQAAATERYGAGTVTVTSALVDLRR